MRGSRSNELSRASISLISTRLFTSTRWVKWSTRQESRRAPRGIPTAVSETVTYMIDGIMEHQDSEGGGGVISNGDTQWMTAGKGILHIETPPEHLVMSGGLFNGFQLWVNLPAKDKWLPPRYQDIRGGEVSLLTTPDGGALLRLIAGSLGGHDGPGDTHTPITMVHATISPGARMQIPWRSDFNSLAYVLNGDADVRDRAASGSHGPARCIR